MKKLLLLAFACTLLAGGATAQTEMANPEHAGRSARTPEQQADLLARRLTRELTLSAEQTTKVRQLALARANERAALKAQDVTGGNSPGMGPEMKGLRDKYDDQLKAVLTSDQYARYSQLRDDQRQRHKEMQPTGPAKVRR